MQIPNLIAKLTFALAAAFAMSPALSQAQHSVTFTEQNGVLTEASDLFPTIIWLPGSTDPNGTEHWERPAVLNGAGQLVACVACGALTWAEPGVGEGVNGAILDSAFSDLLTDIAPGAPDSTFQGATVRDANGDLQSASIKWIDLGDSSVPEATRTLGLLGLACLSLAGLRLYLSPQTATV